MVENGGQLSFLEGVDDLKETNKRLPSPFQLVARQSHRNTIKVT